MIVSVGDKEEDGGCWTKASANDKRTNQTKRRW